jgi:membrane protease YdiL (CAAX protease family)
VSYNELLHEQAPKRYPIDALGVGIYLSIGLFAAFLLTGLANGIGLAALHLQTIFAVVIMVLFPTIALVARGISQGKDVFTNEKTPFRSSQGPSMVLVGMVVVFFAEFFTLKVTPAYAIFSSDLTGQILGILSPVKLFYMFMGFSEEIFFRFGIQAYTERNSHSPVVGIAASALVFGAYHQFVYLYLSPVIIVAGAALGLIYYFYPNVPVLCLIHGGFNLVFA